MNHWIPIKVCKSGDFQFGNCRSRNYLIPA